MQLLAKEVPKLRYIHIGDGILFVVDRDGSGTMEYLHDQHEGSLAIGHGEVWNTRPRSRSAEESYKRSMYLRRYSFMYEPQSEPDLDL